MTTQQFLTMTLSTAKSLTAARGVRWAAVGLVAVGIALIAAATPAAADLIVVDDPGDGAGTTGKTLREALAEAEASPEDDMIVFDDKVSEIHLTQGELWIGWIVPPPPSGALMIDGHINDGQGGVRRVRIDAGGQSGVLVAGSGDDIHVTGLELVNGNASLVAGFMVWDLAKVVLDDSVITGNYAMNGGGGIYNLGELEIVDTLVASNGSGDGGGGLYADGWAEGFTKATNTMFVGNDTRSVGGGILNDQSVVTLTNPTIWDNTARNGGGIFNYFGPLSFSGADFSGNLADRKGNDIYYTTGSIVSGDLTGLDVYEEKPKGGRR